MVRLITKLLEHRAVRYLDAGATGAAVHIGTVFVCNHLLSIWYQYSTIIGFFLALGVSFTLQKFFTFKETSVGTIPLQSSLYAGVATINFFANLGLMYIFVERLHMWPTFAQGGTALTIAVWSYFAYSKLFKSRHATPSAT